MPAIQTGVSKPQQDLLAVINGQALILLKSRSKLHTASRQGPTA